MLAIGLVLPGILLSLLVGMKSLEDWLSTATVGEPERQRSSSPGPPELEPTFTQSQTNGMEMGCPP